MPGATQHISARYGPQPSRSMSGCGGGCAWYIELSTEVSCVDFRADGDGPSGHLLVFGAFTCETLSRSSVSQRSHNLMPTPWCSLPSDSPAQLQVSGLETLQSVKEKCARCQETTVFQQVFL